MQTAKIESLPDREFVKRKADAKVVYMKGPYCRYNKGYVITDTRDIGKVMYLKKGTEVFIDFEF